jgi:hypothetical protein
MISEYYQPHSEALKQFFGMQSRIDNREKAFTFILGVLIGALLHCRSYHDNHAGSHPVPFSQLFSISGNDLSALYDKVMRELNHAPKNSRSKVEEVMAEARHLYASLSRQIALDEETTTYFILYGISVSASICYHPCKREGMRLP